MSTPRVRIAPSPTGNLHIGTARTALFNYLYAKHYGGTFVLRIEDTDLERSDKKYEQNIFDGLRWLGIDPDEGPEHEGPYNPYHQSERTDIYKKHLSKLLAEGKAFYCFHSEPELEEEAKILLHEKRPIIHACEYRNLSLAEAEKIRPSKHDAIIRFKTPAGRMIAWRDAIRGDVSFASDLIGDFSIAKSMTESLYHFAVVVDDYEMKISHVIRGEDHIANTPKHVMLGEALGFPIPKYAHLPLILGPDRSKLSKRHGATSIDEYRKQGYLPEALFNFMALVGWNPGGEREIFSKEELIAAFSLEKVQKSGAIFDFQKLDWMNGQYIRMKSVEELTELCLPHLKGFLQLSIPNSQFSNEYINKVVELEQSRLKKLSEVGELTDYFFRAPQYNKQLLRWKIMSDQEIIDSLKSSEEKISQVNNFDAEFRSPYTDLLKKDGVSVKAGDIGAIFWPLRVALSGKKASPGPFEIMEVLGVEESLSRIRSALQKLQ